METGSGTRTGTGMETGSGTRLTPLYAFPNEIRTTLSEMSKTFGLDRILGDSGTGTGAGTGAASGTASGAASGTASGTGTGSGLADLPLYAFPKEIRTTLSELSKSLNSLLLHDKPRSLNPILGVLGYENANALRAFLMKAYYSQSMILASISNHDCSVEASAQNAYVRMSFRFVKVKAVLDFEMIMRGKNDVYYSINSEFTHAKSMLQFACGLIKLIENVYRLDDTRMVTIVVTSATPLIYVHKLHVDQLLQKMVIFLEKHRSQIRLLNCIRS